MENLTRKMTLILVALILTVISGCTGTSSTNPATDSPPKGDNGAFVKGAWMDRAFVQQLKDRDFNSVWSSPDNFTGFSTFRNENGTPSWLATIPDSGGELHFREGKWLHGDSPIVEFFVEGSDTLARYFVTSPEANGKGGSNDPRIYVRVPCTKNPTSQNADDWYISTDCAYFVYYFAGNYDVVDTMGIHSTVELSQDGTIKGNRMWSSYEINTVNTLPIFYLGSGSDFKDYVIKANHSGFSLAEVMNTEDFEGDGIEVVQGPHVFDFLRIK